MVENPTLVYGILHFSLPQDHAPANPGEFRRCISSESSFRGTLREGNYIYATRTPRHQEITIRYFSDKHMLLIFNKLCN
jgi:hypothetical protein